MQVLCMVTAETRCDVQCPVCMQKYVVYYSRQCQAECDEALKEVRAALEEHHARNPLATAHPGDCFTIPAWRGPVHASAAALIGGAPLRPPQRRPTPIALVKDRDLRPRLIS